MSILPHPEFWRGRYTSAGIQTIPLKPHEKNPISGESWLYTPSQALWTLAPDNANLAVPLGQPVKRGKLAALDGDSPQTVQTLTTWLQANGLDPALFPQVQTPTKSGRHFYFATNAPEGYTWGHLAPDVGAGELRVDHCYVLAPQSVLEAGLYRFVNGDPGALEFAPFIAWRDLCNLLPPQIDPQTGQKTDFHPDIQAPRIFPIRLIKREAPANVPLRFDALENAPKAQPVPVETVTGQVIIYKSRSEVDFANCVDMALAGWEFPDVYQEFERRNVGKFTDKGQGKKYLLRTYQNALSALAANETRRSVALAYETVKAQPWQGRTGLYTLRTLTAFLAYFWQFATREAAINQRDLMIHAGIMTRRAVAKAIERLIEAGYIQEIKAHTLFFGKTFALKDTINHNIGELEPATVTTDTHALAELFTAENYGLTAGAIVSTLARGEALTVGALAERTGKHPGTIRRAVGTLARDGILFQEGQEETRGRLAPRYKLAGEKLTEWAEKLDTGAQLARRRDKISQDRERWQRRRKTPAHMPPKAPKTAQDARNGEKRPTPDTPPFWAQPGNEAAWLHILTYAYHHKDTPYHRDYETKKAPDFPTWPEGEPFDVEPGFIPF